MNYGTYVHITTHGESREEYVDVANFNHYDMIIGMPFMRARKVILDFEKDMIRIGEQEISATKVMVPYTDDCICRYRSTDKRPN